MSNQLEEQCKRMRALLVKCGSYLDGIGGHCKCEPDQDTFCPKCEADDLVLDIKEELEREEAKKHQ